MTKNLQERLSELVGTRVRIGFPTNSIWVVPNLKKEEDREWRIWIDPPWRIVKDRRPLMASIDCPYHKNYEDEEEYKKDFEAWCSQIGDPAKTIASVSVSEGPPDLYLKTEDGLEIQVFVTEKDDYTWYFRDKKSNLDFDATGCGVVLKEKDSEPGSPYNSGQSLRD